MKTLFRVYIDYRYYSNLYFCNVYVGYSSMAMVTFHNSPEFDIEFKFNFNKFKFVYKFCILHTLSTINDGQFH